MYNYVNPKAIPVPNMNGFFIHPDYSGYAVNREALVWSFRANKFLSPWFHYNGVYRVNMKNNLGYDKRWRLHRLIAWFFVPLPPEYNGNYDKADATHINRIKTDNRPENLIWVPNPRKLNYEEDDHNVTFQSVCTNPNRYFYIDINFRGYVEFESIEALAKSLQVDVFTISSHMNNVLDGRFIIGCLNDPKWQCANIPLNMEHIINDYMPLAINFGPKLLIDTYTNETTQYDTYSQIAEAINCPLTSPNDAFRNNTLLYNRYKVESVAEAMDGYYRAFYN